MSTRIKHIPCTMVTTYQCEALRIPAIALKLQPIQRSMFCHATSACRRFMSLTGSLLPGRWIVAWSKLSERSAQSTLNSMKNSSILHLDVSMHGGEIEVYQPFSAIDSGKRESFGTSEALSLLDSTVEIEGIAGGAFDTKAQLTGLIIYAQQRSAIRVIKRSTR